MKRRIIKMEIEFECPATQTADKAFAKYFKPSKHVAKLTSKVLEARVEDRGSVENTPARRKNEHKRIVKAILAKAGLTPVSQYAYHSNSSGTTSISVRLKEIKETQTSPAYYVEIGFKMHEALVEIDKSIITQSLQIAGLQINLAEPGAEDKLVMVFQGVANWSVERTRCAECKQIWNEHKTSCPKCVKRPLLKVVGGQPWMGNGFNPPPPGVI